MLVCLRVGARRADPAIAVLAQSRSDMARLRVAREDMCRRILYQALDEIALLVVYPAVVDCLTRIRSGAKGPVDLDDGVIVIPHLRTVFVALGRHRSALGKQREAGRVASEVGAQTKADVSPALGHVITHRRSDGLEFLPCVAHVCQEICKVSLYIWGSLFKVSMQLDVA